VARWESVRDFLPQNVTSYVEEASKEGLAVVEELFNTTRGEAVERVDKRVDQLTSLVERLVGRLEEIYLSATNIVRQEKAYSDLEIQGRNSASNLTGIKEELGELKGQVERERQENSELEGVEGILQGLITSARDLLRATNSEADLVWSKFKQLELEFYQASEVLAGSSLQVRKQVMAAFQDMKEEVRQASQSPALRDFIDAVFPTYIYKYL